MSVARVHDWRFDPDGDIGAAPAAASGSRIREHYGYVSMFEIHAQLGSHDLETTLV